MEDNRGLLLLLVTTCMSATLNTVQELVAKELSQTKHDLSHVEKRNTPLRVMVKRVGHNLDNP